MDLKQLFCLFQECRHAFLGALGCVRLDSLRLLGFCKELLHGLGGVALQAPTQQLYASHKLCICVADLPVVCVQVTAEQEAAIQARLQVRPRRTGPGDGRSGARTRQLGRE
jgi:hypothetical protein